MNFSPLMCILQGARLLAHPSFDFPGALKELLKHSPNLNARDVAGNTSLMFCTNYGSNSTTLRLATVLIKAGAEINARNRYGATALFEPVMNGNLEAVRLLMESNIDHTIADYEGTTIEKLLLRPAVRSLFRDILAKRRTQQMRADGDIGKCALCGNPAKLRCSRCQRAWYCTSDCQRTHWASVHKRECNPTTVIVRTIPLAPELSRIVPIASSSRDGACPAFGDSMAVKVQGSDPGIPMLVCDRTRSYTRQILATDVASKLVQSYVRKEHGKAYFQTVAGVDDTLTFTLPALEPKPW